MPEKMLRAAQYVRMSTDEQQHSIANQKAAIAEWAAGHGVEVVATYEDAGRSGLTLSRRPALQRLMADVLSGPRSFDTILVYDVSRWGRFQDADESAHLEYLCRSSGVTVHYCAEAFSNDGTPLANLCKVLKRALAAEYSRELSEEVAIGKARLAGMGFHQGSDPGYGLQRRLVDCNGVDKGPLAAGQRKSILTDRVILSPGAADEIAAVRWMFEVYADGQLSMSGIAESLNRRRILRNGRLWNKHRVCWVLGCPKYAGDYVWGMNSYRLSTARREKPRAEWIVCSDAFDPIVSRELFERVQARRASRYHRRSDEELISRLKQVFKEEGRLSRHIIDKHGLCHKTYIKRFGSLQIAYGYCGTNVQRPRDLVVYNARVAARSAMKEQLKEIVEADGGTFAWDAKGKCATFNDELVVRIDIIPPTTFRHANYRGWQQGTSASPTTQDLTLVGVLGADLLVCSCYLFPPEEAQRRLRLRDSNEQFLECFRVNRIEDVASIFRRDPFSQRPVLKEAPSHAELNIEPSALRGREREVGRAYDGERRLQKDTLHHTLLFLQRKRDRVEKAARVACLRFRLQSAIDALLEDVVLRDRLKAAGVHTMPATPHLLIRSAISTHQLGSRGMRIPGVCALRQTCLTTERCQKKRYVACDV